MSAECLDDVTDTASPSDAATDTMDVVIDSTSAAREGDGVCSAGPSRDLVVRALAGLGVGPSWALSALAVVTEQEGLTDWLFVELVGTPPLSERCNFSGGSGVLNEPEESVI